MANVRYAARPLEAIRNRELEATGRETWSESLEAVYVTDPEVVAAVLPPPLEPGPEPLVRLNVETRGDTALLAEKTQEVLQVLDLSS